MDFFQICTKEVRGGIIEAYPDFMVLRSKDMMVRSRGFYAIWDEALKLWSTDEYDVQRLVDEELRVYAEEHPEIGNVKYMRSFTTNGWNQFRKFMSQISDNSHQLDEHLTFANTETKKSDYVSRRLSYDLIEGDHSAWDELVGTLYEPEERAKIEWAIGAVVSGDSRKIQKFLVFYGAPGYGKGTVLDVILKLFEGYTTTFEAKALVATNNSFALEVFRNNPLVGVQHDGDLSNIADNTKINSITSHESMTFNEKYKPSYTSKVNAFLFMGTNKPVRITDAKSGIIRRLIDVHPSGVLIPAKQYHTLVSRIDFELGAIAKHCLDVYHKMGKHYYSTYRPIEMMFQTDIFFNFIEANFDIFKDQDGITLKQAYALYKEFCSDTGIDKPLPQYRVREELRNYFENFADRTVVSDVVVRSYYSGFKKRAFKAPDKEDLKSYSLVLDETVSLFDELYSIQPAQYAKDDGTPEKRWSEVKTTLSEIDPTKLHYVKVPENHIVIDFDLKDDDGQKSLERNLDAASLWPATYAELSKSGAGIHLHYTYEGEVSELATRYDGGIEIKTLQGDSSLRRRLTKCNNVQVANINSGLPFKEKKVLQPTVMQSEKGLRELIARNLRKEIHPGTKPSIDFIHKILEDAYQSGMSYDVTDLRSKILSFAAKSSNQSLQSLKVVQQMRFQGGSEISDETTLDISYEVQARDERLVFFDVEVYPNLFVICWKYQGDSNVVRMINPSPREVEALFQLKLVGFNNRRYDNHIIYARYLGYDNEQLYKLSTKIMDKAIGAMFGEAYNLSYADIYDFSSVKQGLKKFQIDLGIHHMELDFPWDQPVDGKDWAKVVEYCVNDVVSTETVFESRRQDFVARQILADLSGLSVNDTTQKHTARIVFGTEKNPQKEFVYTELSKEFPGYEYDRGKSTYRGEETGEGGYVYAEPGVYESVAVLDIASMHPTSIGVLRLFGDYTDNFTALTDARITIKRGDFSSAKKMLGGKLAPYLSDENQAKALSHALKIIINIVYGLTSAKFDNPFRDPRNKDNIVAKRGALFMIDLKHAVQEMGFTVAHIKTDSIKIPNATPEIIEFVKMFGEKYGYDFEYKPEKDFYDAFCLVNDAVYIARKSVPTTSSRTVDPPFVTEWEAVGAQFQHPYVFKTLFSHEPITFNDLCETKQVSQGAMYIDFDAVQKPMIDYEGMHFVGRTGRFIPVREGFGGGILYRVKDEKAYSVTGTKGYLWIEAELAQDLAKDAINMDYFERLVDEARKTIDYFGSFENFARY